MGRTLCIEPSEEMRSLAAVLLRKTSGPVPESLTAAYVERVVVDTADLSCSVSLRCEGAISGSDRQWLEQELSQDIPACSRVELSLSPVASYSSLSEWLEDRWERVRANILERVPLANGWITTARTLCEDDCLILEISDEAGVALLSQKGVDGIISGMASYCTGRTVRTLFRAGDLKETKAETDRVCEERRQRSVQSVVDGTRSAKKQSKSVSGDVLLGKPSKLETVRMRDIEHEEAKVAVEGQVFAVDTRRLKNGKTLVNCKVTDGTGSFDVKVFEDEPKLSKVLRLGDSLRIEGSIRHDSYQKDLVLMARSISRTAPDELRDEADTKRVELHLHTKMSAMDAVCECEQAVRLAALLGHSAVAITDHGVVQSFPVAAAAGEKHGVKIIYGMEGYLVDEHVGGEGSESSETDEAGLYHIVVLARNQAGLKNLYRLVSESHIHHFYKKPRIPRALLERWRDGLILGSACEAGEVFQAVLRGDSTEELESVAAFYDYLEVQPICNNRFLLRSASVGSVTSEKDLEELNRTVVRLGARMGKLVAATGDVHFLRPEDAIYREILQAGQKYEDASDQPMLFYRTTQEMMDEFGYLSEEERYRVVVEAPVAIAEMVDESIVPLPSELCLPKIPGADDEIREMSYRNARSRYGEPLPQLVEERLERELDAVIGHGFAVNYLIAQKLVAKSLEDGFQVGSRGSVGSSLVATMCHISEVNPLPPHYYCPQCRFTQFVEAKGPATGFDLEDRDCPECSSPLKKDGVDIPFETFLGFEGDKVPDIDLNFADVYLSRIQKYTEELFGSERVIKVGTVGTIADRTAYGFVKGYLDERDMVVRGAEVERLALGVTGVKRSTSQHPGGLLIIPEGYEICDFCPVQFPADDKESGVITSHFNYHSSGIDECLTKLDLLGKGDPTMLRVLQDLTGLEIDEIPIDDPDTLMLFSGLEPLGVDPEELGVDIGSLGIPEYNTSFGRQILADTRPKTFDDLIKVMGLFHGTDVWLNNAQELIEKGTATSLGEVICCRDDIMLFLIEKGVEKRLAFSIMEKARKGRPLSDDDVAAMEKAGVPDWYIKSCKAVSYLFPKAHAAAYAMMAVRIAFFKVHYPIQFYAAYFSTRCNDFDVEVTVAGKSHVRAKLAELRDKGNGTSVKENALADQLLVVLEALLRGISFLPVDIYRSEVSRSVIEGESLRMPFVSLSGIGQSAAESIVAARAQNPFSSVEDLRRRTKLSKTVTDLLQRLGSLSDLPDTDQLSLF